MSEPPLPEQFGIDHGFKHVERLLAQQHQETLAALARLEGLVVQMPTRADFDAAKQQLQAAISDAANRVSTDIQALRDALAQGNPVTDQDLADLQSDVVNVANIDAPAPTPPTP